MGCLCKCEGVAIWDHAPFHRHHQFLQHQHKCLGGQVCICSFLSLWDCFLNVCVNSFSLNFSFLSTPFFDCRHVFKRLKFLGNKLLSQMFTLLFLAIWHGLHSGYLICFSLEFIIVNVEKQVTMATSLYQTWGVKLFRIEMTKVFESLTFMPTEGRSESLQHWRYSVSEFSNSMRIYLKS